VLWQALRQHDQNSSQKADDMPNTMRVSKMEAADAETFRARLKGTFHGVLQWQPQYHAHSAAVDTQHRAASLRRERGSWIEQPKSLVAIPFSLE